MGSNRKQTFKDLLSRDGIRMSINTPQEKRDFISVLEKKNYTAKDIKDVLRKLGAAKNSISPEEAMKASGEFGKRLSKAAIRQEKQDMELEKMAKAEKMKKEDDVKSREIKHWQSQYNTMGGSPRGSGKASPKDISQLRGQSLSRPMH